jgi:uncharacterized protein
VSADIIIIGASARAAAGSARRAGLRPWCVDLFADADLRRLGPVRRIALAQYPKGLIAALADAPEAPLLYTGALENYPKLLARVSRPLWGNLPGLLGRIRSPFLLARRLRGADLPGPAVAAKPTSGGRWLLKPRRGAGGLGIRPYAGGPFQSTHYLQEWLDGMPVAAVFLGRADGGATLLGATQQLIGIPWLNATGFHYAGSVGPLPMAPATRAAWQALGAALMSAFGLRGLFGVDAILRDGIPWPVEINPRYTASIEVLERAFDIPLLALHRAVFEDEPLPPFAPTATASWGKAILYARRDLSFPREGPWRDVLEQPLTDVAPLADIPQADERILAGQPVLTLFASAPNVEECMVRLQEAAQALDRRLGG